MHCADVSLIAEVRTSGSRIRKTTTTDLITSQPSYVNGRYFHKQECLLEAFSTEYGKTG